MAKRRAFRVTDPNDNEGEGSIATYYPTGFRSWVHEVFLEGYKCDIPLPSLADAIEIVEGAGCSVKKVRV